jgi:hypothetical protein
MTRVCALLFAVALGSAACAGVFDKCVKPEITAATKLAPADLAKEVAAFLTCGISDLPDLAAPCAVAGLADLALALGPGGEDAVNCIVSYYENNASGLLQSRAKAVGAKRGVTPELYGTHACNGIRSAAVAAQASVGAGRGTTALESPGAGALQGPPTLSVMAGVPRGDVPRGTANSSYGSGSLATATAAESSSPPELKFAYAGVNPGVALAACTINCRSTDVLAPPGGCLCWRASKTNWRESRWVASR